MKVLVISCLVIFLAHGTAGALVWSDLGTGASPFVSGWSAADWYAAAHAGDASMMPTGSGIGPHNLALGSDPAGACSYGGVGWQDHALYPFEITFDGSLARWSILGPDGTRSSLDYASFGRLDGMNALALGVAVSPGSHGQVTLDDLTLNGAALGTGALSFHPAAGMPSERWWGASDVGDLSHGFTLAGNLRWDWSTEGSFMGSSDLQVNVRGANTGDTPPPPVPEPGTLMLLGSGVLGMGTVFRARRRA